MKIEAKGSWQRVCQKGEKAVIQNQGSFDIFIRVSKEDDSHGTDDEGWIIYPKSPPTEPQEGAVWIKSTSGLPVNVLVDTQ